MLLAHSVLSSLPLNLAIFGLPGNAEFIILLVVILLLFGNRLPGAMKNLGQSFVQFKKGIRENDDTNSTEGETKSTSTF